MFDDDFVSALQRGKPHFFARAPQRTSTLRHRFRARAVRREALRWAAFLRHLHDDGELAHQFSGRYLLAETDGMHAGDGEKASFNAFLDLKGFEHGQHSESLPP
jgi:hypothetical protein